MTLSQIKRRLKAHQGLLAIRRIERFQDISLAVCGEADDKKAHVDELIALAS